MNNVKSCLWGILFLVSQTVGTASAQTNTDNWPDFPLLNITTENGTEPTATVVDPPEGCL